MRAALGALLVAARACGFARAVEGAAECSLPRWPGVDPAWRHGGASELCFCAYATAAGNVSALDALCPAWRRYVSLDGVSPGKLARWGGAIAQGRGGAGNASYRTYGSMTDWGVDLGSGFGEGCDVKKSADCRSIGAHVLGIPGNRYVSQPLGGKDERSLEAALAAGGGAAFVTPLLADLARGGIGALGVDHVAPRSCDESDEDPTAENDCVAQCFHETPDVRFLHLHTTSRVKAMLDGPVDSGLGPDTNASEAGTKYPTVGAYNICVCEPEAWAVDGRGNCPTEAPSDPAYPAAAARALCRNLAGAARLPPALCD